jgi:hypothetical protein
MKVKCASHVAWEQYGIVDFLDSLSSPVEVKILSAYINRVQAFEALGLHLMII